MKVIFLLSIPLLIFTSTVKCQNLQLYWGNVSSYELTGSELHQFYKIEIIDTVKHRKIADVSKFRFFIQPLMDGPVKMTEADGPLFNSSIKELIMTSKPGDRIVVSDIFAYVENEGNRKIPVAAVFEVK